MKYSFFTVILFATSHLCWAQNNGYQYDRPQVLPGGGGGSSTRPGGFPGIGTIGGGGFPSTATTPAFGGYPSGPSPAPGRPGFGTGTGSTGFPGRPGGIQSDTPVGSIFPGSATGFPTGSGSRPGGIRPTPGFPGSIGRPGTGSGSSFGSGGINTGTGNDDGSYPDGDYSAIPGSPGVDYPIYSDIPQTSFDCNQQQYPGYYADVEAQCQVFHICALNKTFDFLCPNGTIFSQETLVCVWWNQFDCGSAPALYPNNAFIYDYSQTGRPPQQGGPQGGGFVQPGSTGQGGGLSPITQRPGGSGGFPGTRPGVRPPTGPGVGYPGGPTGPSSFPGSGVGTTFPGAGTGGGGAFPGAGTGGGGGFPGAGTGSTGGFPSGPGATPPTPGGFPGAGSTGGGFPTGPSTAGGGVTPTTGFGTTVRPGGGGFPSIQGDTGFINGGSSVTPQAPNREYLPPRRT